MATKQGRQLIRRGERLKRLAYELGDLSRDARRDLDNSSGDALNEARRFVNTVAERYLA